MKFSDSMSQARIRYINTAMQQSRHERMADGRHARILILPNVERLHGIGATDAEAWWNLREAFDHWVEVQIENGRGVPHMPGVRAVEDGVKKLMSDRLSQGKVE